MFGRYLFNFRIIREKNDLRAFLLPKTFPNPKEMSGAVYWGRKVCSVLKAKAKKTKPKVFDFDWQKMTSTAK